MTNDELNRYIKHYIEKDRTGRALMLTGPWGIGKSYYIKNTLIPFLEKKENGKHTCIVVSLYGLSSLQEVSKAIYLESRIKKLNPDSEAGKIALFAGKTVLKGVASFFGVDLSADEKAFQSIYDSIDLSEKLIILEDVERTQINILELLGYVNNLVEQDGVKVLLVTNEEELIRFEPLEETVADANRSILSRSNRKSSKPFTKETQEYLTKKEKTVGDTISFSGDLHSAIKAIVQSFKNEILNKFSDDQGVNNIAQIMYLKRSANLRSVIFGCQKAVDLYEIIPNIEDYSEDFLSTILYGILFFSFQVHAGNRLEWKGLTHYSTELGGTKHPLFRFCFDYIQDQQFDPNEIPLAVNELEKLRLYDRDKTNRDPDLLTLYNYYLYTETEVVSALERITKRLQNPDDISFFDYGNIAFSIITLKDLLDVDIESVKELLIKNLKGRQESLSEDDIFRYLFENKHDKTSEEFLSLRKRMCESLYSYESFFSSFDYSPDNTELFCELIRKNDGLIHNSHGLVKHLDISSFVQMFIQCSASQMDDIRAVFQNVYRSSNIADFLTDDAQPIRNLIESLSDGFKDYTGDRIKKRQIEWFIDQLKTITKKFR